LPGPLHSKIGSFISPTQMNLQSPAVTKVSMATVFWGTDDTDAIQAAEDAASLGKSTVLFPPGTYVINRAKNTIPSDPHKYGIEKKSNTKWLGCGIRKRRKKPQIPTRSTSSRVTSSARRS
jgi:hypothetical protein